MTCTKVLSNSVIYWFVNRAVFKATNKIARSIVLSSHFFERKQNFKFTFECSAVKTEWILLFSLSILSSFMRTHNSASPSRDQFAQLDTKLTRASSYFEKERILWTFTACTLKQLWFIIFSTSSTRLVVNLLSRLRRR